MEKARLLSLLFIVGVPLQAEMYYSFANISLNYLDWDAKTEQVTTQKDFTYTNVEGGAGWDWGEFYGNASVENPTKTYEDSNGLRFSAYGDFDINIKGQLRIHFQDFAFKSHWYYVNDFVSGLSYKIITDFDFWIKPFIGVHHTYDSYYRGLNGYMTGWTFNYDFEILQESFSLFQWNEIEFLRDKSFYKDENGQSVGDGKSYGLNGALSLWWHINSSFTTGLQYRYANHKLGNIAYQSAYIYTCRYNF